MANRNFKEKVLNLETGLVMLSGHVVIASDASITSTAGKGFTVAKSATATYTITLSDVYSSLLSVSAMIVAATAVDLVPQCTSYDVTSAKTIVIKTLTGAVVTAPAAACELHFTIILKNSSV